MDPLLAKSRSDKKRRFSESSKVPRIHFESQRSGAREEAAAGQGNSASSLASCHMVPEQASPVEVEQLEEEYEALKANYDTLLSSVSPQEREANSREAVAKAH
ncbi:uncharacterized protein LOC103722052 [Phoenix dactylifera]|uniref:Uncharacterized protein LOC103722052 n=1 Tax=Phoenix dactylifera TaxID=42345 RepID=A0A8B7D1B0_PHODC|nr:uncharacterized protein LOC103722052 [Phoenix dactylifera]